VNRIFISLLLILSIFLIASASASNANSTSLGISYTKINVNTYNVTFWDNNSLNITINQISNSNISHFSIDKTTTKTYTINSNVTLVMLYNNTIITQITLKYTSIASFFSLTITILYNETYLVQYRTLIPATLLIKNSTGVTILSQILTNQYGSIYVPSSFNPNSAVILYNNTPEIIQPFPYIIPPQVHTIIVYEGISDKNAILIVFGSFFGSILVGIAIITGTKRSKYEVGTNKSDMVYERLGDNPIANIKIEDPKKLNEFTALAQKIGEIEAENRVLRDEVNKLTNEMEKIKGRFGER